MKYVIGIDIGGTNLRIGTVDEEGNLTNFERKSSESLVSEGAVENLGNEVKSYIERYKLEGRVGAISVGVPSMVSKDKSFIYSTPNLKGLENIDLGHLLGDYVNIPVFFDRDVNYLLVNDIKTHGLDPDRERTILGFYLGTGFGNAVYINGQLHVGKNGVAGELGHIPMYGIEEACTCGNIGCSETRCSGRYLRYLTDTYFPDTDISEVFVKHGDDPRIQEYVDTLAIPMATEINILDPDYVIMAGGVMVMDGFPMDRMIRAIKERARKPFPSENLEFIFPKHTQDSGVIGGAYAAFDKLGKNRQK